MDEKDKKPLDIENISSEELENMSDEELDEISGGVVRDRGRWSPEARERMAKGREKFKMEFREFLENGGTFGEFIRQKMKK